MICKIRAAKPLDLDRLIPLVAAYYEFDSIKYDRRIVRRAMLKLLRDRSLGRVWVADSDAGLVGYLIMTYNYDLEFGGLEGIITEFFLMPNQRAQGLGARLFDTVREFCLRSRIGTIELQVSAHNHAAQSFYQKIGFKTWDRIVMSIDVASPMHRPDSSGRD